MSLHNPNMDIYRCFAFDLIFGVAKFRSVKEQSAK